MLALARWSALAFRWAARVSCNVEGASLSLISAGVDEECWAPKICLGKFWVSTSLTRKNEQHIYMFHHWSVSVAHSESCVNMSTMTLKKVTMLNSPSFSDQFSAVLIACRAWTESAPCTPGLEQNTCLECGISDGDWSHLCKLRDGSIIPAFVDFASCSGLQGWTGPCEYVFVDLFTDQILCDCKRYYNSLGQVRSHAISPARCRPC